MTSEKLEHLEWAITSRTANQRSCLRLLTMFDADPAYWRTKKASRVAQELIAAAFSLWRAAFLAEKSGKRGEVFSHGREFLAGLIEDNAIAYVQDKRAREWTFNYYTRNAKYSLKFLARYWGEDGFPLYKDATRSPKERWDYCQSILDQAITFFEAIVEARAAAKKARAEVAARRRGARERRKNSRELTKADRKGPRR